jgi:hypothetical protein
MPRIDRTSAALAMLAGFVAVNAIRRKNPEAAGLAAGVLLAWIGYDRWHDGLWPFTDRRRQIVGGYTR